MADLLTHVIPRSVWYGWGDPTEAKPLSAGAWSALEKELGVSPRRVPNLPVPIEDVRLPDSRLTDDQRSAVAAVVGAAHVTTERRDRVEHAGGKSYPDIKRLRDGDGRNAPDAVAFPADAREVAELLRTCSEAGIAVVPFGGGTSVVGGVGAGEDGPAPVLAVDLRRMDKLVSLDPVSRLATFEPGLRGPEIEAALRPHGLTMGHYPQSHQEATLGGYVATRSAGQASTGYGRSDQLVIGARLATPRGELVVGNRAPATAAGPRLTDLVVGSEGAFGIITEATMRVVPAPTVKRYASWAFGSYAEATEAFRALAQELGHGVAPDVCRLSDAEETEVSMRLAGRAGTAMSAYMRARGLSEPCISLFLWEGRDDKVLAARQKAAEGLLREHGIRMPKVIAQKWEHGRFSAPYLRDELMGHGVLVDTLETATTWENLHVLHDAVSTALHEAFAGQGTPAIVQCHVSHLYEAGASLYYTFIAKEAADPIAQWRTAKDAASRAIIAAGGTITHHHAVGTDHRPYLAGEIGGLGVEILRAVKATLDPEGILNPGKLIPTDAEVAAAEAAR